MCSLLIPDSDPPRHRVVDHRMLPQGSAAILSWPDGSFDVIMVNRSGGEAALSLDGLSPIASGVAHQPGADEWPGRIVTDARLAVLRIRGNRVAGLLANDVSRFDYRDIPYARIRDGKLNLVFSADTVSIDRPDADFSFYLPRGGEVRYEDSVIRVLNDGGFAVPDRSAAPAASGPIRLRAFPNPFNATANIVVDLDAGAEVDVDDLRRRGPSRDAPLEWPASSGRQSPQVARRTGERRAGRLGHVFHTGGDPERLIHDQGRAPEVGARGHGKRISRTDYPPFTLIGN